MGRLPARVPTRAIGALGAQVMLALVGFVLQVVATRSLGSSGLGTFALLYGTIIMATALSTGLLGDSLTVLDRSDPAIRRALLRIAVLLTTAMAIIGGGLCAFRFPVGSAALFAMALAVFVAADLLRRLIMTGLRFWSLVLADLIGLVAMVLFLALCSVGNQLVLNHFLGALIISQSVAAVVAFLRLPAAERRVSLRGDWGNWTAVIRYGIWRGVQQFVRPTMLNGARWVVLLIAGTAAVGEMEAARVFVAPAMLLVQGFGSYLFSSYADRRAEGQVVLLTMADRVAKITVLGSAAMALIAWPLIPTVGSLLTGDRFELDVVTVLGWACYAASCATVLPYGNLAAVQGRQQWVLLIRILDSLLSLGLVAGLLFGLGVPSEWAPWLLSVGSFAGGLVCRQLLLRPTLRPEVAG